MDWNGDGHRDMLVGCFGGEVMYFAGQPGGKFAAGTELRFDNGEIFLHKPIVTEAAKKRFPDPVEAMGDEDPASGIWVTDWDQDGDLDIVSGWFYGGLFVSRNNGTPTDPKLSSEFELIHAGGKPLTEVFQTEPTIADWDGDGRDDLIYGTRAGIKRNDGAVYWCRNTADKGDPVYEAPRLLVESAPESQMVAPKFGRPRAFGTALTPSVIDWDGDGDLDLLIGDYAMLTQVRDDLTEKEFEEFLEVRAEFEQLTKQLKSGDQAVVQKAGERYGASLEAQKKYTKDLRAIPKNERAVGRVWLLIRN